MSAPDRRLTLDRDDPTLSLRRQCALLAVARSGVSQWMGFYNHHRPHQALRNRAPMAIWREAMIGALPPMAVAMALAVAASLVDATALNQTEDSQRG
ncbi:integrase core domain-containing protein [Acidibrevibacterium fodinaquatile]|uniref:integrase core domain-containing protein n=1 Tax=Acidibrevibacterium fodinaquatile TaxID=1969806 RepID=UPI000E0CDE1D|nr:integrase core domain-containing protein [Acidibrevibacterium fodinaquatile]